METNKASGIVRIERTGPPSVLSYQRIVLPAPGPGEVLIKQEAIGVNYLDVFQRNGTLPVGSFPAPLGSEAAGVVEAVGPGASIWKVGDRIAYHLLTGAYAEKRVVNASDLMPLPPEILFDQAAAVMVKGLTAHMLIRENHTPQRGQTVLIHAMTGGVGSLLSSWARSLGATVIGTVGSPAKKKLAIQRGFEHVVDLQTEDFVNAVHVVTGGTGVDAVYDSVGGTTFERSAAMVKEGGAAVSYGWASGLPVVDEELLKRRRVRFERPALMHYLPDRNDLLRAFDEVFDLVRTGVFEVAAPAVYPLAEAARAHEDLESRRTTGSLILRP